MLEALGRWYQNLPGWRQRLLAMVVAPVAIIGLVAATARAFRSGLRGDD